MIDELKEFSLVYLAAPYGKYHTGIHNAFVDASTIAAKLMAKGVKVYSPIAHTHPLAIYGNIDPTNNDIWLPFDEAIMAKSDAMVVARMEGWENSSGIKHEIDVFRKAGKPIFYLALSDIE